MMWTIHERGAPSARHVTGPGAWPHLLFAVFRDINIYFDYYIYNNQGATVIGACCGGIPMSMTWMFDVKSIQARKAQKCG